MTDIIFAIVALRSLNIKYSLIVSFFYALEFLFFRNRILLLNRNCQMRTFTAI